ncbi:hypothetical protein T492DRAFT_1080142 [Pavlovales sp. CCMP2436]|nr:hypothetical protein T492DRAFT_1080142 [Pavlovales sp. CCMP2436]
MLTLLLVAALRGGWQRRSTVFSHQKFAQCALAHAPSAVGFMALKPMAGKRCARMFTALDRHAGIRWTGSDGSKFRITHGHIGFNLASPTYLISRYPPAIYRVPARNHAYVSAFRQSIRHPEGTSGRKHKSWGTCGYGCWLYYLLPPWSQGTGMVVDMGRTLVFANRSKLVTWCEEDIHCIPNVTAWRSAASGMGGSWCDDLWENQQNDMGWALKANRDGFDSIQIVNGQFEYLEPIITPCAPRSIVRAVVHGGKPKTVTFARIRACSYIDGVCNSTQKKGPSLLQNCVPAHGHRGLATRRLSSCWEEDPGCY